MRFDGFLAAAAAELSRLASKRTIAACQARNGTIRPVLNGKFFRHEYEATIQGRPRHGEETIAFDSVAKRFQISWVDDFHMNYAIMFSEGEATERGFVVKGKYAVAPKVPIRADSILTSRCHLTRGKILRMIAMKRAERSSG